MFHDFVVANDKAYVVKACVLLQKGGKNQLWVLKQDVHRGKGVHVMKESAAIDEVRHSNS